jgi:CBS domain-containing protein
MARALTDIMRPVVWCRGDDPVRDAARRISEAGGSCALVRTPDGVGIVTDHDFRRRVASGAVPLSAPVAELASVPALGIDGHESQETCLLRMVEHGVHHLVITDAAGGPIGIVRAIDLAQIEVRDPLLIRSVVDAASDLDGLVEAARALPAALVELRASGLPAGHVGAAHASVVDAIVRRAIVLRADPVLAEVSHSWVLLGSLARREPLPLSDLDTALIWEDCSPDPAEPVRAAAKAVLHDLGRCGLVPCPNGANATNPLFSRSRADWSRAAREWMHDPTREGALLQSAMIADSRPLTNPELGRHLTDVLRSHMRTSQFLRALLDEALAWRPPTGVVRAFIVKRRGEHRGELDLKRALTPAVAIGRWIGIATGNADGTTPQRLRRGADAGLLAPGERDTLLGGFEMIYALLLDQEVGAIRAGATPSTYVSPQTLDPLTRRVLRETLRAIRAVQTRVDQEALWRLTGATR